MSLQVGSLVEVALTNGASVGRFLHVKDLVHGKSPGLAESLAALGTLERLLFGMDVTVITEMLSLIHI